MTSGAALAATNDAPAPGTAVPEIESDLSREEQIAAIRGQLAVLRGGTVGEPDIAAGASRLSGAEVRAGRSSRIGPGNPGGRDGLATRSGEGPDDGWVAPDAAAVAPPSVASADDTDPVFAEPAVESAEPPGAAADTERRVAVLPFVNLTRNSEDDWMSSEMTAALRIAIDEKGAMGMVALASTDQSIALESAGARSAVWFVGGGFQRIGDQLRITARVLEVSSGVLIGSAKGSGTVAELDTPIAEMVDTVQAAVDGDESAARTIGARSVGDDHDGVAEVAAARRSP